MKSINTFLSERLIIEKNNEIEQILLKTINDAKKFFNIEDKDENEANEILSIYGLSLDLLNFIYDYKEKYKQPAPIVGNYGRNKAHIAFRRWLNILDDEILQKYNFNIYEITKRYKGLHNTSLHEDGVFMPSATHYEYLIAFAYNKLKNTDISDLKNMQIAVGNNDTIVINNLLTYYYTDYKSIDAIGKTIVDFFRTKNAPESFHKLLSNNIKIKPTWVLAGGYKNKPSATPKTDIISNDNEVKISIKLKEHGKFSSQLMR